MTEPATATLLTIWWALEFENLRLLSHNLPVIVWSLGAMVPSLPADAPPVLKSTVEKSLGILR